MPLLLPGIARRLHRRVTQPQWMKPILRDAGARRIVRMLRRWQAELERTSAPLREAHGWYAALGCDPGATAAEIQQAYRKRMREQHPDLAGYEAERQRRESLARQLNEARSRALGYLQNPHAS
jgi:hypothetical protein